MHEAVDETRVAYAGAVQVPICLGSVAVPLPQTTTTTATTRTTASRQRQAQAQQRRRRHGDADDGDAQMSSRTTAMSSASHRCKHRRYCYLRDGGTLAEDAFCRWLLAHTRTHADDGNDDDDDTTATSSASAAQTRKRARGGRAASTSAHDDTGVDDDSDGDGDAASTMTATAATRSPRRRVRGASLLYALIDHVVFVVPKSFAQPRRVRYAPPYVIADDTWAPHVVEVTLYFLAHLGIAPLTLAHHVLLQPHCEVAPQLRATTFGQSKPAPLVLLSPSPPSSPPLTSRSDHAVKTAAPRRDQPRDASATSTPHAQLVVSERKDSIRIVHPSVPVVQFVRRVVRKARGPTVSRLRRYFDEHVYATRDDSSTADTTSTTTATTTMTTRNDDDSNNDADRDGATAQAAWRLPYEEHIAAHVRGRAARTQRALQSTLAALHDEQARLWRECETAVRHTASVAQQLNDTLDAMHAACVRLGARAPDAS